MSATEARPASALDAVTGLLDLRPAPAGAGHGVRYGLVAGRSGPRFLVPLDHPAAAPEACLAYLGLRDLRTRATRGAVGLALKARLPQAVVRQELVADGGPGSLLAFLEDLLAEEGEPPGLAVAVGLGHLDDVWKPTLQVFRPDGRPAAFAKVGLGPAAASLVATEAATLEQWGRHHDPRLVVPELLASTTWNGIPLVVVGPLPTDARRLPAAPTAWAVRELDGPVARAAVGDAPWWTGRRSATIEPRVAGLLDRIEERHGATGAAWARWHGDWVPWNLARCHRGLVAWDWEYSEPGAPVGLDEVHGAYQQAHVVEGASIAEALAVARRAASALAAAGTSPAGPEELRARAGRADPSGPIGSAAWLADAHVAMLATRLDALEALQERPAGHRAELLAAAEAALDRSAELTGARP
ncbi:MAG: hypothetical protein U0P45_03905 [Acidimicrobiales bacterium]